MKVLDEDLFKRATINIGKLGVALLLAALVTGYFAFIHYRGEMHANGLRLTLRIVTGIFFYAGAKAVLIKRALDRSLETPEPTPGP